VTGKRAREALNVSLIVTDLGWHFFTRPTLQGRTN
jgi:hypothetical protein